MSRILTCMKSFPAQILDCRYRVVDNDVAPGAFGNVKSGASYGRDGTIGTMPAELAESLFTGPILKSPGGVTLALPYPEGGFAYRGVGFTFLNRLQEGLFERALADVPRLPASFYEDGLAAVEAFAKKAYVPYGVEVVRALLKHLGESDAGQELALWDEGELGNVVESVPAPSLVARG